jgi:transcriptional regulator with XRE-family HTH domain
VTIGDALAEARRQAGLTVTQVSQRTCIRETIIRGIERNDFSACGGDFYARGHIRSIARAVGADPEPLIREYDTTHGAPEAITAADVFEPSTPIKIRERRRPNWSLAMLVVLAAIVGVATYHFLSSPSKPDSHNSSHTTATPPHPSNSPTKKSTTTVTSKSHHHHRVVIVISAVNGPCWVYLTSASTGQLVYEGTLQVGMSRTFYERHPVNLQLANPGGVTLTVNGKSKSPGAAGQTLTFGPDRQTVG